MAIASSARSRFAYVAESAYGTTPATPTFKTMRLTGGGMRTNKQTAKSEELQPDRNVRDEMQLGQDVAGSYPFEFSYTSFDDFLEAALFGTWTTNVLKNGDARKSFTIEETIEQGATDTFRRFTGCMVNTFSLDITARQRVMGSMAIMGRVESLDDAIVTGATYTAANTKTPMTAGPGVGGLSIAGLSPAPILRRLQFQVSNNLRVRPEITSPYSQEFGDGHADVTGTMEAYFDSKALYEDVLAHGGGAIAVTLGSVANEKYTISMPNTVFLDGSVQIGGQNDDVMAQIGFRAKYKSDQECSIRIERAVA